MTQPVRWMSEKEARWAGNAPIVAGGTVARIEPTDPLKQPYRLLAVGRYPNGLPIGDGPAVKPREAARMLAEQLVGNVAIWPHHHEDLDTEGTRLAALRALSLLDPEAADRVRSFREEPTPERAAGVRRWLAERYSDAADDAREEA